MMFNFSVLMSVYYKEKPEHLESCLESLVAQSLKADEVVLVEDGPIPLNLKLIIEKYSNPLNIISISLPVNVGLAEALNEGLKYCSHELVARMDTDDIAMPNRFEKQVAFMRSNLDVAASSGVVIEFSNEGLNLSKRELPLDHNSLADFAKKRSPLSHPATIFRKDAIFSVGGYPDIYPEDYLLWINLINSGFKIANIPDEILMMRTDNAFIARRGWTFWKGEVKIYYYMYKVGFLNLFELCNILLIKSVVRLSPNFIKILLYKMVR